MMQAATAIEPGKAMVLFRPQPKPAPTLAVVDGDLLTPRNDYRMTIFVHLARKSGIRLTRDQLDALEQIEQARRGGTHWAACLHGYAGTGKTTLMRVYLLYLQHRYPNLRVAVTAPINQAVKLLKTRVASNTHVDFITLHRLMNAKPANGDTEEEKRFVFSADRIRELNIIVVDEASMINAPMLENLVRFSGHLEVMSDTPVSHQSCQLGNRPFFLFAGDGFQLPPVERISWMSYDAEGQPHPNGGHVSPALMPIKGKREVFLNRVMRQKEGNPILELSQRIREVEELGRRFDVSQIRAVVELVDDDRLTIRPLSELLDQSRALNQGHPRGMVTARYVAWRRQSVHNFECVCRPDPLYRPGDMLIAQARTAVWTRDKVWPDTPEEWAECDQIMEQWKDHRGSRRGKGNHPWGVAEFLGHLELMTNGTEMLVLESRELIDGLPYDLAPAHRQNLGQFLPEKDRDTTGSIPGIPAQMLKVVPVDDDGRLLGKARWIAATQRHTADMGTYMEALRQLRATATFAMQRRFYGLHPAKGHEDREAYIRWAKGISWRLQEYTPQLRMAQVSTTYKSQGSTWHTVMVDLRDLAFIMNDSEYNRHLYVAITRASDRVIFGV